MVISMCKAHCKFFLCECFLFGYFIFYGRIKSYTGLKYFPWSHATFGGFFTILFGFCQLFCTRSNPPSSHLNARRYFGRMLSCRQFRNSNISQHGNIVIGFRFHVNWKDERLLFRWSCFMVPWSRKLLDWIMGLVVNCQPPPFHLNARRYFGRILSCRQFEYLLAWEYCGGFSCHGIETTGVFYSLNFVFMIPGHALGGADGIMGLAFITCAPPPFTSF